MNVSVIQLCSIDKYEENSKQLISLLDQVPGETDLICCPENSLYLNLNVGGKVSAIDLKNPKELNSVVAWVKSNNKTLVLGSVPLAVDGLIYNSTIVIGPKGEIAAPYQKMFLFDVDVSGDRSYKESDLYSHGKSPALLKLKNWLMGLSICYDLRFSEIYYHYARSGVDAILVPSAFTVPTGKAHWEILLRARAIETQSYVIAAAQGGDHGGKRQTYGNSMIIDPWGEILAQAGTEPCVISANLSKSRLSEVRRQIPMAQHRKKREELFQDH